MFAEIQESDDWLEVSFPGVLNLEVLLDGMKRLNALEQEGDKVKHKLVDLRSIEDLDLDFEKLMQAKMFREAHELREPSKTAIIVDSDVQFGLVRMWQSLGPHQNIIVESFKTRDEAESWLQE